MRKLKVSWDDFEAAIESRAEEIRTFLDLETGAVLLVLHESMELLEELLADSELEAPTAELVEEADIPESEKEDLRQALRVEERGDRLLALEDLDLRDEYRDLEDFTATVQDPDLRRSLQRAMDGPGAFRRFRALIHDTFHERKAWFAFQAQRRRERAADWLAAHEIEVEWLIPEPVLTVTVTPREHLLAGVLKFTRDAAQMPGVRRISLLGSLTRDQPDPKDADVLVMVSDDMDLSALAQAGRQLAGHAQQQNRGADVFLTDERGQYIGRTCHWRDCGPGIRASCDAAHCGRRHYLHDDFGSVRLAPAVVAAPPIDLWPTQHARVTPPADVERVLLAPLRTGGTPPGSAR